MIYDYVIIGAGIAGCSVAHFLKDDNVLLIDKNEDVAFGASGAAGAFLSPLLGKPNKFKDLVTQSLKFAVPFYKEISNKNILNKGVLRLPKDEEDIKKFNEYKNYFDFDYEEEEGGYFFKIGSQVNPYEMCKYLTNKTKKKFNYKINDIKNKDNIWILNSEIKANNLILTTGADTSLIDEKYLNIRAIFGQKIDIATTSCLSFNIHKECTVSSSSIIDNSAKFKISIGATHERLDLYADMEKYYNELKETKKSKYCIDDNSINTNTKRLLELARYILPLNDVDILDIKIGARASSLDYFPILGELIDSKKTIDMFPYLTKGTDVKSDRYSRFNNIFILNGLGGRGFVLSPVLAKKLVDFIKNGKTLNDNILIDRLFKKWVRKKMY